MIFTKKNIPANTELTYDYNLDINDDQLMITCHCGVSDKCSGYIGVSKRKLKIYMELNGYKNLDEFKKDHLSLSNSN